MENQRAKVNQYRDRLAELFIENGPDQLSQNEIDLLRLIETDLMEARKYNPYTQESLDKLEELSIM